MVKNNIKPIETVYNGYRFRSRLEARWAVFFDAMGIEYEYEQEGFETKDGAKYLPDFILTDSGVYVEVKGMRDGAMDELKKVVNFVKNSGERVLVLTNIPENIHDDYWWFPIFFLDGLSKHVSLTRVFFEEGVIGLDYGASVERSNMACWNADEREVLTEDMFSAVRETYMLKNEIKPIGEIIGYAYSGEIIAIKREDFGPGACISHWSEEYAEKLNDALTKARQARFEFDETPKK